MTFLWLKNGVLLDSKPNKLRFSHRGVDIFQKYIFPILEALFFLTSTFHPLTIPKHESISQTWERKNPRYWSLFFVVKNHMFPACSDVRRNPNSLQLISYQLLLVVCRIISQMWDSRFSVLLAMAISISVTYITFYPT